MGGLPGRRSTVTARRLQFPQRPEPVSSVHTRLPYRLAGNGEGCPLDSGLVRTSSWTRTSALGVRVALAAAFIHHKRHFTNLGLFLGFWLCMPSSLVIVGWLVVEQLGDGAPNLLTPAVHVPVRLPHVGHVGAQFVFARGSAVQHNPSTPGA